MTTMFLIRSLVAPCVSLFAIGRQVPWLLPCFIPVLAVAFNVARNYLLLARDLKRIDSTTKSPVSLVQRVAEWSPDASVLRRRLFTVRSALRWIG